MGFCLTMSWMRRTSQKGQEIRTGSSVEAKIGTRHSDLCRPIENPPILGTSTIAIVSKKEKKLSMN